MPNIAQQDYIIIDWEGKDDSDAAKKAEVDAQLKNIYLANPLTLLSVIFKDYGDIEPYGTVIAVEVDDPYAPSEVHLTMWLDGEMSTYTFSIV